MKHRLLMSLALSLILIACRLPQSITPTLQPAATPTPPSEQIDAQEPELPTAEPTSTPPPLPTATSITLPTGQLAEAERALHNGDWSTALAAYQAALDSARDGETQSAALAGLGRVYYLSGDAYNAQQVLSSMLEAYPQTPVSADAYYFLARSYSALNQFSDAAQAYLGYLALRPGLLDAYIQEWRGDVLQAAGDSSAALSAYQAALNSPRLTPDLDLETKLAQAYALAGDPATALILYDDIAQRSSQDYQKAQTALLKGRLLLSQNQPETAYQTLLDAVYAYPRTYDAYQALVELVNAGYPVDELQRGIVDYNVGEYGVALAALDRYLEGEPADPASAFFYRGLALRALNDAASAVQMWDEVIANYADSQWLDRAWEEKGYTQWAFLNDYPAAIQTFLDFTANNPVHPRAPEFLFFAARVAERSGDLALASQLWQRTVAEYPTASLAYESAFQAGITEYRSQNYISAQEQFKRASALAASPEDQTRAFLWSGKTYAALNDMATAQAVWLETALIDPTGYYSERANDLAQGKAPFEPPGVFDLGYDAAAERQNAEAWLRQTFGLADNVQLDAPGELANEPRFQRAMELWRLGLLAEATDEIESLRISLQNDPLNTYLLTVALSEQGIYRPAILASRQVLDLAGFDDAGTLEAPIFFNRIRFGGYYADLLVPLATSYNFNPLFLWSVIRQESLFDAGIRSSASARGLMQITPPTGQDIANRLGWPPGYTSADLNRPIVSLRFGVDYLSDQRYAFNEDLYAALAAYNAGPGNAAAWKNLVPNNDPDLFLEVIRFEEPRRYIKGIYEIYKIYLRLYDRTP